MDNPKTISLVLIPGFMLDETLWDDFCPLLPDHWKVSRAKLTGGNVIKEIAQHIAEQSPERFVLIGFSLGGYVARQLAADYTERVSALVLIASSLREDTEQQAKAKLEAVRALSTSTFSGLSSRSIAASLHPRHASDIHLISRIRVMGSRLGYEAFATQSGLRRADVPRDSIHCPTLIVASTHDALRSMEETNELVGAIPGASLELFHDSGHMIPLEQPQDLAAVVIDWLNSIGIY
ncbi:alpha/beta fold hydrolase [Cellvibrio sp. ARAG 10.3]|uniref:alpha/beta fold hydrolase n=1 Tax=Cellvibrio sp. ARAG 10.3 TaxID=3451358 RepID=UPI003F4580E1